MCSIRLGVIFILISDCFLSGTRTPLLAILILCSNFSEVLSCKSFFCFCILVKFASAGAGGGGAIIGRDYLALLEKHRPELQWDKNSGEHFFFYNDDKDIRHAVFYPSLKSISLRLEEARSWGCGISIWEIGQGLDYFFDLL